MNTLLFIGGIGLQEILLIALVVLLFFGGKKIPELMKGMGKGVRSFKEGMNESTQKEAYKSPTTQPSNSGKYLVHLNDAGATKLELVKAIKEVTGCHLEEAQNIINHVPCTVMDGLDETEARKMAEIIQKAGGTVEVKAMI